MTLDDFIKKYDGQLVDWDHFYGGQCMDLYRQYVHEVLNYPQSPAVKGAKNVWDTYLTDYFDRVLNTETAIPNKGDVIIWGNGEYGHIAIFTDGEVNQFNSFDQNFPLNSKCHIQNHNYKYVLGWLTPKKTVDASLNWLKQMFMELGVDLNKAEGEVRGRIQEIIDGYKKYGELEKRLQRAEKDLAGAKAEAADFEQRLITAEGTVRRLNEEVEDQRGVIVLRDAEITALKARVDALEAQIDPQKVLIVTREEYARLTAHKTLDKFTSGELFKEIFKRFVNRG